MKAVKLLGAWGSVVDPFTCQKLRDIHEVLIRSLTIRCRWKSLENISILQPNRLIHYSSDKLRNNSGKLQTDFIPQAMEGFQARVRGPGLSMATVMVTIATRSRSPPKTGIFLDPMLARTACVIPIHPPYHQPMHAYLA
jgi:hypothetical protein